MRKIYVAFISAFIMVLLLTGVVIASTWEYRYPITVTDNTSTSRTYLPVFLNYGAQSFVNSGKMDADGLNTNMQIGDTSIKYMLHSDNVTAVIPNLPANGSTTLNMYTGYSPDQTSLAIITGSGGYVTVSDDADLEVGNNGTYSWTGYIDMSQIGENIFIKSSAVTCNITGSDNITAWINGTSANVTATGISSGLHNILISPNTSNLTMTVDGTLKDTYYETLTSIIRPNTLGDEEGMDFSTSGATLHYQDVDDVVADNATSVVGTTDPAVWHRDLYNMDNISITNEIEYISVTTVSIAADTDSLYKNSIKIDGTVYEAGVHNLTAAYTSHSDNWTTNPDTGLAWVASDINDMQAGISFYGDIVTPNSFCTQLYVTVYYKSCPEIPDNANDLIIGSDATPYINSANITVDGVLIAQYQPDSIISGTTLPDETGNGHDGTITFGTSTGIELSYGEMESYQSMVSSTNETGGLAMPSAFMPSTWFAMGENIEDLPFYDSIYGIVQQLDFPDDTEGVQTIYFIIIVGIALAAMLFLVMFTRSALLGFIALIIVLFIGSSMTIIPMWVPFAIIVTGFAIMYLYRQVAYG